MSFALDANVLIYAAHVDDPNHVAARRFLDRCVNGNEVFVLPWPVLMAFVRVSTNARAFRNPLPIEEAMSAVDALLALPHVRAVGEEAGFVEALRKAFSAGGVRGPLVSDAHVAAILRQDGIRTLYTTDADFKRFDFLDVRDPLKE